MVGKIIESVFEFIAPSIANWRDCKKIKSKIDSGAGCNPPSEKTALSVWTLGELSSLYESERTKKAVFEDKAKINVIGITITVTLVMGAYTLIQNVENKYSFGTIYWIAFAVFVLSVIYMLAAGLHAIHVITSENIVHIPDKKETEEEKKKEYDIIIAMNRARDLIRNNYVFTSYECIRNSLFCLFIVMVIAIFPLSINKGGSNNMGNTISSSFYYSTQAIQSINDGVDQGMVEEMINGRIAAGNDKGMVSVIDDANHIFIKYSVDAGKVDVYLVETYTN